LERVCNRIIELNKRYDGGHFSSAGNYSDFLEKRAALFSAQETLADTMANTVKGEIAWLRKGPKARTTKQQARIDRAGEMIEDLSELKYRNAQNRAADIDFTGSERQSKSLIRLVKVEKSMGGRKLFGPLDVHLGPGDRLGLLGENGSGKSTLLRILAGIEAADRGHVVREGTCGYCPQEPLLYPHLTPDEHFELFACAYGISTPLARARGEALLDRFGLSGHRRTVVQELSGGMRQKVNLAVALIHDPRHLLLDEPYSGLDFEAYSRFTAWVKEARADGKCVVLITHMLFDRDLFDVVLHLEGGRVRVDAA